MATSPPSTILGQRTTQNVVDLKDRTFEQKIMMIEPDETPFVTFLSKLPSVKTENIKYEHAEIDFMAETVQVNGAVADTSEDDITLDSGHAIRVPINAVLWNKTTGELMRVTQVNTATEGIKVSRGFGSTTATAIADNEVLVIVSEAQEEGVKFSPARTTKPTTDYNYVQDFETAIEATWRQQSQKELTESDWKFQVAQASVEHKKKQERSFLLKSPRVETTGPNNKQLTYTEGLLAYIDRKVSEGEISAGAAGTSNNVINMGATYWSETTIENWLESFMHFGNFSRKVLITSPATKMKISRLGKGYLQTGRDEKILGILIERVAILGHLIPIITSRLLAKVYPSLMICVDMSMVRKRQFSGQGKTYATKWYTNVQDRDVKAQKDVLHCTEGLEVMSSHAHGYIEGADD